ncbi:MAG: hypothetical protein RMJ67_02415 [Elusimicrobiota bacterium]|nr:hypothetical protein [Endomicrobiia bacterium]MDW8165350.1 hypothetical protein [Elusimicrobiota bacterium]
MKQTKTILYVCNGNVFRSVFAEGYTLHLLAKYNIDSIKVYSCGIIAEEDFCLPESIKKLFKLYNIKEKDLSKHIPTRISQPLLEISDLVLVMENKQLDFIYKNFKEFFDKCYLLKKFAGFFSQPEIFDPIGQPESVYLQVAEEIKICVEIIIKKLVY